MKDILNKILEKFLCKHDWGLFEHIEVYDEFTRDIPSYNTFIFICKKCGKIKKVKS